MKKKRKKYTHRVEVWRVRRKVAHHPVDPLDSVCEFSILVCRKIVEHANAVLAREAPIPGHDRNLFQKQKRRVTTITRNERKRTKHDNHARETHSLTKQRSTKWLKCLCPMLPSTMYQSSKPRAEMMGSTLYLLPLMKKTFVPVLFPDIVLPQRL